jgi:hypothetical protein
VIPAGATKLATNVCDEAPLFVLQANVAAAAPPPPAQLFQRRLIPAADAIDAESARRTPHRIRVFFIVASRGWTTRKGDAEVVS